MKTPALISEQMEMDQDFSYNFASPRSAKDIFKLLLDPTKWWLGFYEETISGKSENIGDEFEFFAGHGAHYSKHRLVGLQVDQTIVWGVTDSTLSFLTKTDEWIGTMIRFDLEATANGTFVTFTHQGLIPRFECYGNCQGAWTQYMANLETKLK